jgi:hypothetical protein
VATTDGPNDSRPAGPTDQAERHEVIKRAQQGDRQALPRMLAIFDEEGPRYAELFGNMATHVEKALVSGAAGNNFAVREGLERKLSTLRGELAGPDPTPIERLLAERAAFCWLTVYEYERNYSDSGNISLRQGEYYQRRIDAAHRRFLSSLRTLAAVRKLGLPDIRINVAENQVNVG